ncbi:phospholipase A2 [Deinococcus aestuarii]|uniref:phospholipase A2 n=1 Tax=Deinococcus aestuarii TaxID=2774531 RepID=UPI001C0C699E|nr:phospholipase A2 [Deinococcus aestuarii]
MLQKRMFGVLLGSLVLASCNQATLPDSLAQTPVQATDVVRSDLAAFKQLQEQVQRGEVPNPVDSEGKAVDLPLLISQIEQDLANPLAEPVEGAFSALAVYSQATYTRLAADDKFTGNLSSYKRTYPRFNWSNDGCSVPHLPEKFRKMIVFHPACVQHDFGYRNARSYPNLMNENHREWVDGQFKQHMRAICSRRNIFLRPGCYADAQAFWLAVRWGGKDSFY